ncbi:MAG: hypothetical protein JSR69_11285 [Proteobacteria bacterium]|nr:hypothetical protein [Pseudomonadota bacterium]
MNKTFLSFVLAFGVSAASSAWAVGGEGRAAIPHGLEGSVQVAAGGVATSVVAGASGLLYGGQHVSSQLMGGGRTGTDVDRIRSVSTQTGAQEESDGSLAQILTGLALVVVLIGKRISG